MEKISEALGGIVMLALMVFFVSTIGGTILWFIYEDSIQNMFPKAVESGWLAKSLEWWVCVKIVWVFSILVKSVNTGSSKKDKE